MKLKQPRGKGRGYLQKYSTGVEGGRAARYGACGTNKEAVAGPPHFKRGV
ncbi:hypothetical protein GMST_34380 [Geomonas silvestris]|uniref:Uncharacterized protein n=1 Tax=Geomonas silvestris TaxID=2740184 RepID=A0A6V8MN17_9BACT|nr:hypothetical protein GMST_34380 [Geomonas silvestris]